MPLMLRGIEKEDKGYYERLVVMDQLQRQGKYAGVMDGLVGFVVCQFHEIFITCIDWPVRWTTSRHCLRVDRIAKTMFALLIESAIPHVTMASLLT
jgi:hypothetical protein